MRGLWTMAFACCALDACGGQTQHPKVEEVPIDQGGGGGDTTSPDESGGAKTVVPDTDATAPPGVGPQSLDTHADAGASTQTTAPATFVKRANGLTEKQCNDVVFQFAKLMNKEHQDPQIAPADIPKHPVYGQMYVDCGAQTTKKQYKCAIAARTTTGWKKCME